MEIRLVNSSMTQVFGTIDLEVLPPRHSFIYLHSKESYFKVISSPIFQTYKPTLLQKILGIKNDSLINVKVSQVKEQR